MTLEETPRWLIDLVEADDLPAELPIERLLKDSCYYPCSRSDRTPIAVFKEIDSFVYCDYVLKEHEFKNEITQELGNYTLIKSRRYLTDPVFSKRALEKKMQLLRDSNTRELIDIKSKVIEQYFATASPQDSRKEQLLIKARTNARINEHQSYAYGDPDNAEKIEELTHILERCTRFFMNWSIWGNADRIFSLLYISWEATECYKNLYLRNNVTPKLLTIIQPGHTFGGNWINFFDTDELLWRTVKLGPLPPMLCLGSYEGYGYQSQIDYDWMLYTQHDEEYTYIHLARKHTERFIRVFQLDLRSEFEKREARENALRALEDEELDKQRQRIALIAEQERKWIELWPEYKTRREFFKRTKCLSKLQLSSEMQLQKTEFDKAINRLKRNRDIFNAIKRRDIKAINALLLKGVDLDYRVHSEFSIREQLMNAGLSKLLVDYV